MLLLDTGQVQAPIAAGSVCTFAVDTNVFQRFGHDIDVTTLFALAQFALMNIEHLVTDVVEREVRTHRRER